MAPIHDTDLAEERWSQAEWEHFELWEKIESRLRRRKLMWIGLAAFVFLLISSVPILIDRSWKWKALSMSRQLAQEINQMKREAGTSRLSNRIRFAGMGSLSWVIEKAPTCAASAWDTVRRGTLGENGGREPMLALMDGKQGASFQIPGLVESFCYDPLQGSALDDSERGVAGFGIVPVKDLTELRPDRVSVLVLKGPSAELSFE